MKISNGYLVAIEGIDAVGKNTQTSLLSAWLKGRKVKTSLMSFPDYGTPIGKEIKSFLSGARNYPRELQHLLFAANRWEKFSEIKSRLAAGEVIIVDRYTESNLAYGTANGLDAGWLASLENGMPTSDLVIVLDAPPKSLGSRRPVRTKDAYEKSSTLQSEAQRAYRKLAKKRGWKLVDADGTIESVRAAIASELKAGLKRDRGVAL